MAIEKRMFTVQGNMCADRVRIGRAMHKPPLTQAGLAEKIQFLGNSNMTEAIIRRIEKGDRHVCDAELKILAEALGASMSWLVEETNDPGRK